MFLLAIAFCLHIQKRGSSQTVPTDNLTNSTDKSNNSFKVDNPFFSSRSLQKKRNNLSLTGHPLKEIYTSKTFPKSFKDYLDIFNDDWLSFQSKLTYPVHSYCPLNAFRTFLHQLEYYRAFQTQKLPIINIWRLFASLGKNCHFHFNGYKYLQSERVVHAIDLLSVLEYIPCDICN